MTYYRLNLANYKKNLTVDEDGWHHFRAGRDILALVEAVEAAHDFYEGDEKDGTRLRAAFARFEWDTPYDR